MRCLIIMPVHNEAVHLTDVLQSFVSQTVIPDRLIIVNDNSTDASGEIIESFASQHSWIYSKNIDSIATRIPGAKVVEAFEEGIKEIELDYWHLIGKFDGDVILPENYFENLISSFSTNPRLGLAGGHLYININNDWIYETVANRQKVRGPIKLYRTACFKDIGGLRKGIGWDTADQLLATYKNWHTVTFPSLIVKHLKPTGSAYSARDAQLQGQAFHNLRYGFWITLIAAMKLSWNKRSPGFFFKCVNGHFKATSEPLVTREEGQFIRSFRWKQIRKQMF